MQNRAMEFLYSSKSSFPLLHNRWGWQAKHFIDLAIAEVEELLQENADLRQRLAVYEQHETNSITALIVEEQTMTQKALGKGDRPATALEWQPRKALPPFH